MGDRSVAATLRRRLGVAGMPETMNDATTLALEKTEITLFQTLDGLCNPCLILFSGAESGRRFDLEPGQWILGRGGHADVPVERPPSTRAPASTTAATRKRR
jgi:hypothetical protein